ncbi:MAG: hypothetical protein ACRC2T_13965 [Thermoguttaceae bacterium]
MSCRAVELIGVYLLEPDVIEDYGEPLCNPENPENALLLEMIVPYPIKECDIAAFTQPLDSPRDYWQVPYLEVFLNANGEAKLADPEIQEWHGSTIRIVFFMHCLDLSRPLQTPFGDVPLMTPTKFPPRLKGLIKYFEP